jgi:uncharacterized protein (TIRG00374 family)
MTGRTRRLLMGIGFGLIVVVGIMLYSDVSKLADSWTRFDPWILLPACGIVLCGYGVRALKWEIYLRRVQVEVEAKESVWVFFSGLVMAISPMKVGEVLKSLLLKKNHNIPIARTAPIIVAERLTDVLALILLASVGAATTGFGVAVIAASTALAVLCFLLIASPRLSRWSLSVLAKVPVAKRYTHRFEESYEAMVQLIGLRTMLVTTALSVIAWGGEGIACWWIVNAFDGVNAPLQDIVFIFAFGTLAGALSMLPGGLLATEGSMIGLLTTVFQIVPSHAIAIAATLLTRFCTLWFAVFCGGLAWLTYQRHHRGRPPSM